MSAHENIAALLEQDRPGHTLPQELYVGQDAFDFDTQVLLKSVWLYACTVAHVKTPGDFFLFDLAANSIIIIRGRDGEVRAFHNICRHRGMKFVAEPCHTSVLRCPWHSWGYGLDGRLLATPDLGGESQTSAEGFDRAQLGLLPVAVGVFLDCIFVNIDGQAGPFEDFVQPLVDLLADHELDGLGHIGGGTFTYGANWKICIEGSIEDYHLPWGHPELKAEELRNSTPVIGGTSLIGTMTQVPAFPPSDEEEGGERPWAAHLPTLPLKSGGMPNAMYSLSLFPNTGMLVAFDHIAFTLNMPTGHDSTRADYGVYTVGEAAQAPEYDEARQGNLALWKIVVAQDDPFWAGVQQTAESRDQAGSPTRFSPYWEVAVQAFQKTVQRALEG